MKCPRTKRALFRKDGLRKKCWGIYWERFSKRRFRFLSDKRVAKLANPHFSVRHAKGVSLQWEEDNPPGSCCSSRKLPEQRGPVAARVEASGEKGPGERDQRARRLKHE